MFTPETTKYVSQMICQYGVARVSAVINSLTGNRMDKESFSRRVESALRHNFHQNTWGF